MLRLTLRTLLAYLDDTLKPADARQMGQKVAENPTAQELVDRIRRVTRRRGLSTPTAGPDGSPSDPNTVAEYLSDALEGDKLTNFEQACLEHDVNLAEVAACHQILTMVLSEPVRVPPTARKRMYQIVKGRESQPDRLPGSIVPVGGVFEEDKPGDVSDDADAPLLLGLTSYSRGGSPKRTAAFAAAAAGLAIALAIAVWMTLPPAAVAPTESGNGLALAPVPQPTTPVPLDEPEKPKDVAPPPKEAPTEPKKEPTPEEKKEPMPPDAKKEEPKKPPVSAEPEGELAPTAQPPKAEKGLAGKVERPANVVVLVKSTDTGTWSRANAIDPTVPLAQRILSLPGYRSGVKLETGVHVDLWGNVDVQTAPVLGSEVTFNAPYSGFDADVTVHRGRIYLTAKKPAGAKVRLRFADQVWDVTLPDEKADAVFELVRSLAPGSSIETPRVGVVLAVLTGNVGLKAGYKDIPKVEAGELVTWDNKGKGLDGPKKVDPATGGKPPTYFNRFPLGTDADQGKKLNAALDEISRRLSDPGRAKVVFAEMLQDRGDAGAVQAVRAAVLGEAAVGDWSGMVDALCDEARQYAREAAVVGLQAALAAEPEGATALRQSASERNQLTEKQIDTALRLLRGFSDAEKKQPETIDKLVEALASPAVAIRELAIMNLLTEVDPDSRTNTALNRFDAGGSAESRDMVVKAWKRRAEELKKKLQPMPGA